MAVRVRGLNDLTRAFKVMPVEVVEGFSGDLEQAVEPVKVAAQAKAPGSMRNMVRTKEWSAMRVGITKKNPASVYVVPDLRGGSKLRRRTQNMKDNFAKRMQERALDPALKENTQKVINRAEDFLERVGKHNGF